MTTELQIQTNRQNAIHSTGPKNPLKSARNSLKHGIFSNEPIIVCKYYQEDTAEFEAIKDEFYTEYSPKVITERVLVDRLIDAYWRLLRVNKSRKAMIIEQMEAAKFNASKRVDDIYQIRWLLGKDIEEKDEYPTDEEINERLMNAIDKSDKYGSEEISEEEINKGLVDYWFVIDKYNDLKLESMSIEEKRQILLTALDKLYDICERPANKKDKEKRFMKELELTKCLARSDIDNQNLSAYETTLEKKFYRALIMLKNLRISVI